MTMTASNLSSTNQGWRDNGGLWTVPLAEEKALNIYELPSTKEMIRFGHAALGFPTKPSLLDAIRHKNLVTFPGMTVDNVNKFFPESDKTQKGHIKQSRQGVRSKKVIRANSRSKIQGRLLTGVRHDQEGHVHRSARPFLDHFHRRT